MSTLLVRLNLYLDSECYTERKLQDANQIIKKIMLSVNYSGQNNKPIIQAQLVDDKGGAIKDLTFSNMCGFNAKMPKQFLNKRLETILSRSGYQMRENSDELEIYPRYAKECYDVGISYDELDCHFENAEDPRNSMTSEDHRAFAQIYLDDPDFEKHQFRVFSETFNHPINSEMAGVISGIQEVVKSTLKIESKLSSGHDLGFTRLKVVREQSDTYVEGSSSTKRRRISKLK